MHEARHARVGNALNKVMDLRVSSWLAPHHASYLWEMAQHGVPFRRERERARHKIVTEPHSPGCDHISEMFEKTWKATHSLDPCCGFRKPPTSESTRYDLRLACEASRKEQHPPALQLRHKQVGRPWSWWEVRHPQVPQVRAKRDVSRAFSNEVLWQRNMAQRCREKELDITGKVCMIHLVLVFGRSGSP